LPQGGLHVGEEPVEGARRELAEETGLRWDQVRLLGEHPEWLAYELDADKRRPDTGRGQVQRWFNLRLDDPAAVIDFSRVDDRKGTREFSASAWMTFPELLAKSAAFRHRVYQQLADYATDLDAGRGR